MSLDDLPSLRSELEAHGLFARKSLGQHFLLDMNITSRIARAAGDLAGKPVLEIGPGPGGLTRALLEAGADPLVVIEKDARFLPLLEPLVEWSGGRLRIVHGDALEGEYQHHPGAPATSRHTVSADTQASASGNTVCRQDAGGPGSASPRPSALQCGKQSPVVEQIEFPAHRHAMRQAADGQP